MDNKRYPRRNTEPSISILSQSTLSIQEQLRLIDDEILRVEGQIVKLVMQRAHLKRRRNGFSPAIRLPPEILTLIFEFACHPNGGEFGSSSNPVVGGINLGISVGVGAVTPLFVGTICSTWRDVAKNSPRIWSTFTVHMNNKYADAQAALLGSWLQNTGKRPLAVKLIEDDIPESEQDEEWRIDVTSTAAIEVLAQRSRQWYTIDFFLPSTWKKVLSQIRHELPILTNATLRVAESSPTMASVEAFAFAPKLQEVHLVGYSIADVVLPWAQLRRLDGEYFGVDKCLETLRLCTDLVKCQIERAYRGVRPYIAQPITHQRLESFELIMDDSDDLHALFSAMTLPNLKEVVLSFPNDQPMLVDIVPLVKRSQCVLQYVHLVGLTPSEDDLLDFLRELPMLQVLILINPVTESGGKLSQKFLDALIPGRSRIYKVEDEDIPMEDTPAYDDPRSTEYCLVPKLQRLEYQGATSFTPHSLLQLLVYRWRGSSTYIPTIEQLHSSKECEKPFTLAQRQSEIVSQLHTVSFTTMKKIKFDGSDLKLIQELIEEGMFLEFMDDP